MYGFTKDEKSTFPYWVAHVFAVNMTALNLHCWRPKYLFHDWEKPWMMLWAKYILRKESPYEWVRQWHKTHRKHHTAYYQPVTMFRRGKMFDPVECVIDWEASRFTKTEMSGRTAYEYYRDNKDKYPLTVCERLEKVLKQLGLWGC